MSLYSELPWNIVVRRDDVTVLTSTGREVCRIRSPGTVPADAIWRREAHRTAIFLCLIAAAFEPAAGWGQLAPRVQMDWLKAAGLPTELAGMNWRWLTDEERGAITRLFDEAITNEINRVERETSKHGN